MLLITCPWCGPRAEIEFRCGGEAHIARPAPATASDEDWEAYLFLRENAKGVTLERWWHLQGCRRWFNAARDTTTEEFVAVYRMGEPPPPELRARLGR